MMTYKTISTEEQGNIQFITLDRPAKQNCINSLMLEEINQVLDRAENSSSCRIIVFQGESGLFSTGMDLEEIASNDDPKRILAWGTQFQDTLKRLASTSKFIVTCLDGKAMAGALGIVAASDWVIATEKAEFKLSEALWGLLPAIITPYLIRRMGFQQVYGMTLTCCGVTAEEAFIKGLVDELNNDLTDALMHLSFRIGRISEETIVAGKEYFKKMYAITPEMEMAARNQFINLLSRPEVKSNIRNFTEHGHLPWKNQKSPNND